MSDEPLYIEAPNGRLYEVVEVSGFPAGNHGPSLCVFDHAEQRIAVSDTVTPAELPALIAEYFHNAAISAGHVWNLVPVVVKIPRAV